MNSKKKSTPASSQTRPAGTGRLFKAPTVQLKTRVSAQSIKHPIAPPVYRPQATPKAAQPKMANGAVNRGSSIAPRVHQPQHGPKVLAAKVAAPWISRQPSNFRGTIQQTPASTIQLTKPCKHCGSRKHASSQHEYTVGKSKVNPQSDAHQLSRVQRTYNSFQSYRSDFFDQYTITTAHIDLFFKAGYTLHGHGSGGSGDGENQATVDDANAFVGWYRGKYLQ
jgi:hypothetical protein